MTTQHESDTPRTDAECLVLGGTVDSHLSRYRKMSDFARTLERELRASEDQNAALLEQVGKLREGMDAAIARLEEIQHKSEGRWDSSNTLSFIRAILAATNQGGEKQ